MTMHAIGRLRANCRPCDNVLAALQYQTVMVLQLTTLLAVVVARRLGLSDLGVGRKQQVVVVDGRHLGAGTTDGLPRHKGIFVSSFWGELIHIVFTLTNFIYFIIVIISFHFACASVII